MLREANETMDAKAAKDDICTARVLRTAYEVAKSSNSFKQFPKLIEMQRLNGLDMGTNLYSEKACPSIIRFIAKEMKSTMIQYIKTNSLPFSIMVDESTTAANTTGLTMDIRFNLNGQPVNFFYELIELKGTSGEEIADAIWQILTGKPSLQETSKNNFSDKFVKTHLKSIACDGASAMYGAYKGAVSVLSEKYGVKKLLKIHCLAHRLELGINDAVDEVPAFKEFALVSAKLYALYSRSPKKLRELSAIAFELGIRLRAIRRVFDVRWAMSSKKAVDSMLENLGAIRSHVGKLKKRAAAAIVKMKQHSKRKVNTKKEFGLASYLHKKLGDYCFVAKLSFLSDCLHELGELSLYFQSEAMSPMTVAHHLEQCRSALVGLIENNGTALTRFFKAAFDDDHVFKGVCFDISRQGDFETVRTQFIDALVCSFDKRFKDSSAIFKKAAFLNPKSWQHLTPEARVHFGQSEVADLANHFEISEVLVRRQFRDWKGNPQASTLGKDLKSLLDVLSVIAFSSASCERDFR